MSFGSQILSPLFGSAEMRAVWSDESLVQSWLDVEIAIAHTLAEAGLVPADALAAIDASAKLENIDLAAIAEKTRTDGMPIKPLVEQVSAHGSELVGKYFHWGATTQDILDSGQALRIKRGLALIDRETRALLSQLVAMADAHRATVMVARTNSQDAAPTTWGVQVATYAAELVRHVERLGEVTPRAITGMFGGAVGTLSAFGSRGIALRNRVIERLGLSTPLGAWNGSQDVIAETVQLLALLQGSLARMANDTELLGRAAFAELRRRGNKGASSTMPHKSNPRDANLIQTTFQLGAMYAGEAVHMLDQVDVRSAAKRMISWTVVPDAFLTASAALERARGMFEHMVVDTERMRHNFAHSRDMILSEGVMFALAEKIGREHAYKTVARAIDEDATGRSLFDILVDAPDVMAHMTRDELRAACDPAHDLGSSGALIDEVIERARSL